MYKHAITALTLTSGLLLAAGPALAGDGFSSDDTTSGSGQHMGFFVVDEHGIRTGNMGAGRFHRSHHQRPWGWWHGGWGMAGTQDPTTSEPDALPETLVAPAPAIEDAPIGTPPRTGIY